MNCGLFGKLPSKRDFVVHNVPRQFLNFWENWLQSSIAASHTQLGDTWHDFFLKAPIWRFWIGSKVCGLSVAGAVMPSVDRVGRYFPLTLCACAPDGSRIDPPVVNPMDDWYSPAEDALLRALDESFAGEADELVESLPFPPLAAASATACPVTWDRLSVWTAPDGGMHETLRDLRDDHLETLYGPRSFWWTHGGAEQPTRVVVAAPMPDPFQFRAFLTGRFAEGEL